jgi:hypothetical protein
VLLPESLDVNAHLRSVYTKLGVSSRLDLVGVPGLADPDRPAR